MKNVWMRATERQMQYGYNLPEQITKDTRNRLWGEASILERGRLEPTLPFIADIRANLPPSFTRLVVKTIYESQWGYDRLNPLTTLGGNSLSLNPKDIPGTIDVLNEIAYSLPQHEQKKVFVRLTDQERFELFGTKPSANGIRGGSYTFTQNRYLPDRWKDALWYFGNAQKVYEF
jgi:hypothetical protein